MLLLFCLFLGKIHLVSFRNEAANLEKEQSRTANSMRNIVFGVGGQVLNIIMSFIMRTVFIHTLDKVYLGVNGLFTNILMVFSLADLGVGTAIIYALYKPIARQDTKKIQALMNLYGKAYPIIGCAVIAMGLLMTPFLDIFVKTDTYIPDLQIIFLLFVLNTASTYFLSYKGTLITANQKNYIVTNVVYLSSIACYALQIVVMVLTKNYILTLSIQVATNMLQNVITMIIANRMYPYIKGRNKERLPKAEKKQIYKNVGSLVFYRVGQVVINGTDSIVISSFISIVTAGAYSNYVLITTTVKNLLQQVFHAITASVGNLAAVETEERKYEVFRYTYFANFWMFGFAAVCLYALLTPFVTIWMANDPNLAELILDEGTVILVVIAFYMTGMRNSLITFRDTLGVFREGRFIPLMGAAVNIAISIWLAQSMGIHGVFIGTVISMCVMLCMEPVILYKKGLHRNPMPYYGKYLLYFVVMAATAWLTGLLTGLLPNNILGFIGKLIICLIFPNAVFYLVFLKLPERRLLFDKVFGIVKRRLRRG